MDIKPNNSLREAMSPVVVAKIDWREIREVGEDVVVLADPPVMIFQYDKHDFFVETMGGDVERD